MIVPPSPPQEGTIKTFMLITLTECHQRTASFMFYHLRNQYAAYNGQNFAILIGHASSFLMVRKVRLYLTIKDDILDHRRSILILYICTIKYTDTIYTYKTVGFSSTSITEIVLSDRRRTARRKNRGSGLNHLRVQLIS